MPSVQASDSRYREIPTFVVVDTVASIAGTGEKKPVVLATASDAETITKGLPILGLHNVIHVLLAVVSP